MNVNTSDINPTQGNVIQPEPPKELNEYEQKLNEILEKLKETKTIADTKEIVSTLRERFKLIEKFPSYEGGGRRTDYQKQNSIIRTKAENIHILMAQKLLGIEDKKQYTTFPAWIKDHNDQLLKQDDKTLSKLGIAKVVYQLADEVMEESEKSLSVKKEKLPQTVRFLPKEALDKSPYLIAAERFKEKSGSQRPIGIIVYNDKDYGNIEEIVNVCETDYLDDIEVNIDNCVSLLRLSDQLEVEKIFKKCISFITYSDNVKLTASEYDEILQRVQIKNNKENALKTEFNIIVFKYLKEHGKLLDEKQKENLLDYGKDVTIDIYRCLDDSIMRGCLVSNYDLTMNYLPYLKNSVESFKGSISSNYYPLMRNSGSDLISLYKNTVKEKLEKPPFLKLDELIEYAKNYEIKELKFLIEMKLAEKEKLHENYNQKEVNELISEINELVNHDYNDYKIALEFTTSLVDNIIKYDLQINRQFLFTLDRIVRACQFFEDIESYNKVVSTLAKLKLK